MQRGERGPPTGQAREVEEAIGYLEELVGRGYEALGVHERFSMRYLVIQAVESMASVCIHILARVFGERAEGYPECFVRLAERRLIPRELGSRLARAARLRDLIVHRYWTIDDRLLFSAVERGLGDLRDFVKHMRAFLEGAGVDKVLQRRP